MATAGIDMGSKTVKAVILKDGKVAAKAMTLAGFDTVAAASQVLRMCLSESGLRQEDLSGVTATGAGRKKAPFAKGHLTDVGAAARGAVFVVRDARTVIDVGAEESRAVKCDASGRVVDFAINERCAAGTGSFVEGMAAALGISLEQIGTLSLQSTHSVLMNAQCAVFAESEVVTLVHAKTPKADIARAIHEAIASRVGAMVKRVGIEKNVVLVGGLSKNVGFVEAFKRSLETDVVVPLDPEYISALGAAVAAQGR